MEATTKHGTERRWKERTASWTMIIWSIFVVALMVILLARAVKGC